MQCQELMVHAALDQLLLHHDQFLAGLPVLISKQLRAARNVTHLETACELVYY